MNILISSYVHWWNAEAAYAAAVAETLQADGHRVWVLARPGTHNCEQLSLRGLDVLTEFPLWRGHPWALLQATRALARFQQREGIRIVNVFRSRETPWHIMATGRNRSGGEGPALVRTRGTARFIHDHFLNRRLYRDWCDGLIASSEVVRSRMTSTFGLHPERVRTIYYPAEPNPEAGPSQRPPDRLELLSELGLPDQSLLLGIVGRARPEKGHDLLLEAFATLAERHPRLALLVLDKRYDDPPEFRERVQAREKELGLAGRIRWLGFREDVKRIMSQIDIGVIPSMASEMNCRVAMEFFSASVPVVAFPTGALPEVVEDGVSGFVTKDHEPASLARALEPLLLDPALRERLGAGALGQTETRFSRKKFLADTLAAFEEALTRSGTDRGSGGPDW